jgi:hypothetical protein
MPDTHSAEVKFAPIAGNLVYEGLRNPFGVRFFGIPMGRFIAEQFPTGI